MPQLPQALRAWQTASFAQALKHEIEGLAPASLPLAGCVTPGSHVGDAPIAATVQHSSETDDAIEAKIGVFFTEIIASCGCGAEPMALNAYCEMRVRIAKATAEAAFSSIKR